MGGTKGMCPASILPNDCPPLYTQVHLQLSHAIQQISISYIPKVTVKTSCIKFQSLLNCSCLAAQTWPIVYDTIIFHLLASICYQTEGVWQVVIASPHCKLKCCLY